MGLITPANACSSPISTSRMSFATGLSSKMRNRRSRTNSLRCLCAKEYAYRLSAAATLYPDVRLNIDLPRGRADQVDSCEQGVIAGIEDGDGMSRGTSGVGGRADQFFER